MGGTSIRGRNCLWSGVCKMLIIPLSGVSWRQVAILVWSSRKSLGWYATLGEPQQCTVWKNKAPNTRRGRQESDYRGEASVRKGTTGVDSDFLKPEAFGFS